MKLSLVLWLPAVAVLIADARWSRAEERPEAKGSEGAAAQLSRLNRKALTQLRARQFDAAKETLLEALVIGKDSGLGDTRHMVPTYVELASLYITGEKSRDKAANQLMLALKIDPDFTIPGELETPALKSAYLLARRQAGLAAGSENRPAATPNPPVQSPAQAVPVAQEEAPAVPSEASEPTTLTKRGRGGHTVTVTVVDPDPPARIPSPLFCPLPFEIPPREDMVVRCLTQKQQKKSTAILYYRPEGTGREDFTAVPMNRSPKGWLQATIPGDTIKGKSLSYYIEARVPTKEGGTQLLNLARPEAPNSFLIKEGADASFNPDRENILDRLNVTIADEDDSFRYHRRMPGALWFALGGGTGGAYHGTEAVDSGDKTGGAPVRSLSGFTGAGLLQVEGEIGYQWTKRWAVSAMLRYQYAPKDSSGYSGSIREQAFAGFLRGRYAFLTAGNFQTYGSAGAGGGTSFLVVVSKQCDANNPTSGCRLTHSDTLHGGALGILLGLGASYHLSRNLAFFLDVNEIGTLPKLMALTEVSLGVAVAFNLGGGKAAATDDDVVSEKATEEEERHSSQAPEEP
jgi:hypothetical protein